MRKKKNYCGRLMLFFLLLLMGMNLAMAQNLQEIDFIAENNPLVKNEQEKMHNHDSVKYYNEPEFFFLIMVRTYQLFVSSQQTSQVCVFHPSCSHFGQECIKHYGLMKGTLLSSDRLQRCHGYAFGQYSKQPGSNKLSDPIENYTFK